MRDITLEDTIYIDFTTRAFATGIPTVLAGTPVLSVLEENNATPITAGVSVSVSRASVVGLNEATIVATAANGYESGKGYSVYISTGTVGGVSVVGEVVGAFTIEASASATDLANGTDGLGAIKGDTASIKTKTDFLPSATAGNAGGVFIAGTNAATTVTTSFTTTFTGDLTGNVDGSVASVTAGVTLAAGAVTNASLAGNMEIVFETDFATNYNITRNAWVTNFTDILGSYTAQSADNNTLLTTIDGKVDTAQLDLDTITGSDGVTLATAQALYAPNKVVPDAAGVVPTAVENRQEMDSNSVDLNTLIAGQTTAQNDLDTITGSDGVTLATLQPNEDFGTITKNAAFPNFEFLMVLTSDHVTPGVGLTVSAQRSIDGAAFASVAGGIAEVSNGIYQFDALAADTNGDVITWRFSAATADDTFVTFKTTS